MESAFESQTFLNSVTYVCMYVLRKKQTNESMTSGYSIYSLSRKYKVFSQIDDKRCVINEKEIRSFIKK